MEIKRDYYLNKLIGRKGNGLVKVIDLNNQCLRFPVRSNRA